MRGLRGASLIKSLPVTFLFILHESPRPNGSVVTERKFRKRRMIPSSHRLCGTNKSRVPRLALLSAEYDHSIFHFMSGACDYGEIDILIFVLICVCCAASW